MVRFGWEGVDQAGSASEGAINPTDLPPIIIWCGWEGEMDGRYIPTGHNGPLTVHPQQSSPVGGRRKESGGPAVSSVQRVFSWGLALASQYARILCVDLKTSSTFARAAHSTMALG